MWNKDEIKGKGKQIEGAIKNKAGKLTDNPNDYRRRQREKFLNRLSAARQ